MSPWGTIVLDDAGAEGLTGRLSAGGQARFDGLTFVDARATLDVPDDARIPVTFEGVPLGSAAIHADATAQVDHKKNMALIDVKIPRLHAVLPSSSQHAVQSLDADSTIRIGTYQDHTFVLDPLTAPAPVRAAGAMGVIVSIHLGSEVDVSRDTSLKIQVRGDPAVEMTDELRLHGSITVGPGKLLVQGKEFKVERGTVTFDGQPPDNPVVIATASWDAPDRTKVYADFVGPVKSGKVTLRSDPPHTQNELLSLLMFGTLDGQGGAATGDSSTASTAASYGGGLVTEALNRAIMGHTPIDISTRVDTSDSANPRPELAIQVSRDVTAQFSYSMGAPSPGQNPDRVYLRVDWRLLRGWILEGTVGDQGSSILDMVWRHRY
jgi:translocation and assembly module TamB